jgi:septation ring formation regulator EzrA
MERKSKNNDRISNTVRDMPIDNTVDILSTRLKIMNRELGKLSLKVDELEKANNQATKLLQDVYDHFAKFKMFKRGG